MFLYSLPSMTPATLNNRILLLQADGDRAGAARRRHPARARDARPGEEAARRLALQPRTAPRAARAAGGLRQPRHRRRQHAHQRPARHVQRRARPLRLEAGRQARDLRAVQQLPAAGPEAEVQGHRHAAAHQPRLPALRAAPGLGRRGDAAGRRAPHLQEARRSTSTRTAGRSSWSTSTTTATSCGACPKGTP